jgi:hypothetical protein
MPLCSDFGDHWIVRSNGDNPEPIELRERIVQVKLKEHIYHISQDRLHNIMESIFPSTINYIGLSKDYHNKII